MHWVLVCGYGSECYNWKLQYFAVCKQKQEFIATFLLFYSYTFALRGLCACNKGKN